MNPQLLRCLPCFNPRARVGRDVAQALTVELENKFQSTRPCRARPTQSNSPFCLYFFGIEREPPRLSKVPRILVRDVYRIS